MKDSTPVNLQGSLALKIPSQEAKKPWEQEIRRRAVESGDMPESVRFQCLVAEFTNKALADSKHFAGHPKSPAQFGLDSKGQTYLTAGMIIDGGTYKVTWYGDNVPLELSEVAIGHDLGKRTKSVSIKLDLGKASCWEKDPVADSSANPDRVPKKRKPPTVGQKRVRKTGRVCQINVDRMQANPVNSRPADSAEDLSLWIKNLLQELKA